MKKKIRIFIIFIIMAALVVGYYIYLSNRDTDSEKTKKTDANTQELEQLLSKKIDANYPDTPREVVNMYCRIMKAYYRTKLTDSQIEKLGSQAWLLFGEDLKSANYSLESFQTELKKDIKEWNDKGRYVSDYKVESNSDIDYVTYGGGIQAAIVTVVIYVRNGSDLIPVSHDFMLGKDSGGKWKILSWRESKTSQEAVNEN